jgi:small subunit ribosomal protein S27
MAAFLVLGRAALKNVLKACVPTISYSSKRYLLSQAYSCNDAWLKRLDDPVFKQLPLSDFAIQLRDQYEKQKAISAVDMEILANKLHEMEIDEAEFMEDIMTKYATVYFVDIIVKNRLDAHWSNLPSIYDPQCYQT